jgi:hypothetical protein
MLSNTGHAQQRPDLRYTSWHEVHHPETCKRNSETSELLEPSVEVRSGHEQHPPHEPRDTKCELNAARRRIVLSLDALLLDRDARRLAVLEGDQPSIAQALDPRQCRQELQPKQRRAENKQENVSGDIVSALPRAAHSLARRTCNKLPRIAHILSLFRIPQSLALSAREAEHGIDQRRPKEPLRDKHPVRRDREVSYHCVDPALRHALPETRVEHEEDYERQRRPEPPDFDEVDVEDILLLGEVAGREFGWVRLRDGGVGRGAGAGRERAEDAAEQEGERVDGDELRFEAGREEGRAAVRGERRADGAGGHAAREGHRAVDCGLGFAAR